MSKRILSKEEISELEDLLNKSKYEFEVDYNTIVIKNWDDPLPEKGLEEVDAWLEHKGIKRHYQSISDEGLGRTKNRDLLYILSK
ncbi:hypothetical protein ERUR111494_02510 [Erysipelothrix urinaevulpis]|uniref:hypothetical protein n=1 Tax=Erysipelothrix urinaevulpis TaxID=2683717 RepID=UPI001357333A|nr:hypothetical protein [Erysipelothrix urinaevulpis]